MNLIKKINLAIFIPTAAFVFISTTLNLFEIAIATAWIIGACSGAGICAMVNFFLSKNE